MSSLWVAENPETGMFNSGYFHVQSVCWDRWDTGEQIQRDKVDYKHRVDQRAMGMGSCPKNLQSGLVFSWEDLVERCYMAPPPPPHPHPPRLFKQHSTFFSPFFFLVEPSWTYVFRLGLLRTSKHNEGSDDHAAEDAWSEDVFSYSSCCGLVRGQK